MTLIFRRGYHYLSRLYPFLRSQFYIILNRFNLFCNGVQYGTNLRIFDRIYLTMLPGSRINIGNNFTFSSGDGINPLCRNIRGKIFVGKNAEITIGNSTGISSACLWAKEKISIGNFVNIGGDCIIMDTDAHNLDWHIRAGDKIDENGNSVSDILTAKSAPISIGDYVFIGTRCIILKGVTIGSKSIIAAGSVVTKSVPENCLAGGNPCRAIRKL